MLKKKNKFSEFEIQNQKNYADGKLFDNGDEGKNQSKSG